MGLEVSGNDDLHQLIYVSRALLAGSGDRSDRVANILKTAVAFNRRVDVTGALLACDDWFVQVLEGRRSAVGLVLDRVAADPSHCDLRIIAGGPIAKRKFALWNMCARTLSATDAAIVKTLRGSGRFEPTRLTAGAALSLLSAVGRLQTGAPGTQPQRPLVQA